MDDRTLRRAIWLAVATSFLAYAGWCLGRGHPERWPLLLLAALGFLLFGSIATRMAGAAARR